MCDFSDLDGLLGTDGTAELDPANSPWTTQLDGLYDTLVAYKDETEMPAELVKNTDVGGVEFWSLESGRFMGVMYVADEPDASYVHVQNQGGPVTHVSGWHEGIGVLVMGFLFGGLFDALS